MRSEAQPSNSQRRSAYTGVEPEPISTDNIISELAIANSFSPEQPPGNDFSVLNALIQSRSVKWSKQARALKVDIEFKAIEQEKRRVAKDLHDDVLPLLARLVRTVQSASTEQSSGYSCVISEQPVLIEALHSTVASIRNFLSELHPFDLEEFGLDAALENLCKRYSRLTRRAISFSQTTEECQLQQQQQLALYRAVQAALQLFADSACKNLSLQYSQTDGEYKIVFCSADRQNSLNDWLSNEKLETSDFYLCCSVAGATTQLKISSEKPRNFKLEISASTDSERKQPALLSHINQLRLDEFDAIICTARDEWVEAINRDCRLFKQIAVAAEREKISKRLDSQMVTFGDVVTLASHIENANARTDVIKRVEVIGHALGAVIAELHPKLLQETGFIPSIQTLVNRFRHSTLIETDLKTDLSPQQIDGVTLDARFAIYRVTQEALNNIEKHSRATRAAIKVSYISGLLVISVEDNGVGFQKSAGRTSRGMRNIVARAAEIGATVHWHEATAFATGTAVTISLLVDVAPTTQPVREL